MGHIAPRIIGGDHGFDNLQIICVSCHASKTQIEALSFVEEERPLLSRFSMETYKIFAESPKPPPILADLHKRDDGAMSVDVIRCRYNAFVEDGQPSHRNPWQVGGLPLD